MFVSVKRLWPMLYFCFVFGALHAPRAHAVEAGNSPASHEKLAWRMELDRVDADIDRTDLPHLLEKISIATGWDVYLQPGTSQNVSAKFKNLPSQEALKLLLGKLNFALLPQSNDVLKLCIYKTDLKAATQLIPRPERTATENKKNLIANELVVSLKPGQKIDDLARLLGAKIIGRNEELNAYRLQFPDAAAAQNARALLDSNPAVASIDSNYFMEQPVSAESMGLSASLPFNLKPTAVGDANHLIVGLIDSPVQKLGGSMDQFLLVPLSVAGDASPSPTLPTHGTSMSETILRGISMMDDDGAASKVRILPVDVYGRQTQTTTFDVANGIYQAVNHGAMVINLSLGSSADSPLLHSVIQSAHDQGVIFFAAAGNEPTTAPTYPAAYPEVTAVTAGDKNGAIASYANRGSFIDVVAPGSTVVSYNNRLFYVSGTSASSAYAAGMAAGLSDFSKKSLAQVEAGLRATLAPKTASTK